MFRKLALVIIAGVLAVLGLASSANAQESTNTCPPDHQVQHNLPIDAKNKADEDHNYQIPGGDYYVEAVTPDTVQLCGETWPVYDDEAPKTVPCRPNEKSLLIDSSSKMGPKSITVLSSKVRIAGYSPSEDKQTVMVLLCADDFETSSDSDDTAFYVWMALISGILIGAVVTHLMHRSSSS